MTEPIQITSWLSIWTILTVAAIYFNVKDGTMTRKDMLFMFPALFILGLFFGLYAGGVR